MTTQKTLLTADEFYRLYAHKDGRYELVDGEVVEMAPVFRRHGRTASNVNAAFHAYCRHTNSGWSEVEVGYRVRYGPDTVRGPDVSLVLGSQPSDDDDDDDDDDGFVIGAPDIAVEVISPSNTAAEMERKVGEYLAAGSQRVWVVCPSTPSASRRVIIHRSDGSAVTYTGDDVIADEELLPGFSLPLSEIFE